MNESTIGLVPNFIVELLYDRYKEGIRFNGEHLHPVNLRRFSAATETQLNAVEWEFGHVATLFAFVRFPANQKVLFSNCGKQYLVATLMKNIHVCINGGNQTSRYFGISPPSIQAYIMSLNTN